MSPGSGMRWVFPQAPKSNVMGMSAWYDLKFDANNRVRRDWDDVEGQMASAAKVHELVEREMAEFGIPCERVFVGGFSQVRAFCHESFMSHGAALSISRFLTLPPRRAGGGHLPPRCAHGSGGLPPSRRCRALRLPTSEGTLP